MDFDRYKFSRIDKGNLVAPKPRKIIRLSKSPFLRGPIPLYWLQGAMRLGGTAISVGIVLWYYRGLKKLLIFKIGIQDIANLIGRSWFTAKRGLVALEKEGLITVQRHNGRKHLIEIREDEMEANSKGCPDRLKGGQNES